jgi:tetratricopeptide (TPR) repeat protein
VTNEVRIFVSSTFVDFERERQLLHEEVKPTLDDMSRHFGLNLELSDFRWGVTSADLAHHRTAALCLREVDLCRRLSPEANFLILLGDRAGSRVFPASVPRETFTTLCGELRSKAPPREARDVEEMLRQIFQTDARPRADALLRDLSEAGIQLADTLMRNPAAIGCLMSFACVDPRVEAFRQSLALSITHREILRSGVLSEGDRNRGAVAIIRTRGEIESAQASMRVRVVEALGTRACHLEVPSRGDEEQQTAYESRFVESCTALLGDAVRAARERGSRSSYFAKLWAADPPTPRATDRHPDVVQRVTDWSRVRQVPTLAIIGGPGAGKTDTLDEATAHLRALFSDARFVSLRIGARPDLQNLRTFAVAVIDALSPEALDDARLDEISTLRMPDLIGMAAAELSNAEGSSRLFVLVDDLDRIGPNEEGAISVSWLWSGAVTRQILFTARDSAWLGPDVEALTLGPLAQPELRQCAEEVIREIGAQHLDPREIVSAVGHYSRPGYLRTVVQIAHDTAREDWKDWAERGPAGLAESYVNDLTQTAPFSKRICDLFLGLCLVPDAGISDAEFLAICQGSEVVRAEVESHFPRSRFIGSVPRLVWHRLAEHFDLVIEPAFRAGGLAWRVCENFLEAVQQSVGQAAEGSVEALARLFLDNLDRASARGADVLPRLLARLGRHSELAALALTPAFMKQAVVSNLADPLLHAIGQSPSPDAILAEIMAGIDDLMDLAPNARSHWLLDLAVLARRLGFAGEASSLALKAYQIRGSVLGQRHPLSIAACLEAANALLEARRSEEAERLCAEMFINVGEDRAGSPALRRLRLNQAAALFYLRRFDEAERMLRALLPVLERDQFSGHEVMNTFSSLGGCRAAQGAFEEAEYFAARSVEAATRLMGRRSRDTAVSMVNLAMIQIKGGAPDRAAALLAEVLLIYAEILDPAHPWVANAEHAYFGALSEGGRHHEALAFVNGRLARTTDFEEAWPWLLLSEAVLRALAGGERDGVRGLYNRIDDIVTSSPAEAWSGELVGRSARKFGAGLGVVNGDGKGMLVASLFVWILVVLSAARELVVSEADARTHLATLELRIGQLQGVPVQLLNLEDRIRAAWATFVPGEWPDQKVLLRKLAPPLRDAGLIDAFKGLAGRAAPVASLKAMAEEAQASAAGDSDAAGQALIMLAARAAAAGDFDQAITAQTEAAAMAGRLFGDASFQRAIAILNLGSLYFRAARYGESFDAYRHGLERLYVDGTVADRFGQALQNVMEAGLRSERFVETGRLLETLADRSGTAPSAINLGGMASVALARAKLPGDAIAAFNKALALHAAMPSQQAAIWVEPIAYVIAKLSAHIEEPHRSALADCLAAIQQRSETGDGATPSRRFQSGRRCKQP